MQATRIDERRSLSDIRCPTLIVSARQDALCSVAKHVEMNHLIGRSTLAILENCGHLSPLEQPGQVTEHLARWRSRVRTLLEHGVQDTKLSWRLASAAPSASVASLA